MHQTLWQLGLAILVAAGAVGCTPSDPNDDSCDGGAAGCDDGSGGTEGSVTTEECEALCDEYVACPNVPYTRGECLAALCSSQTTSACREAAAAATCAEHAQLSPPYYDACFPLCTAVGETCQGDAVVSCQVLEGDIVPRQTTVPCDLTCVVNYNSTYTGVCGLTFQGQPSPTGDDVCWCW